jgi:hypothetical protein
MANPAIVVEYVANLDALRQSTRNIGAETGKTQKAIKKSFLPAVAVLTALGVAANKATQDASNLNEQINKAGAVFGKAAPMIIAWSKTTARSLGISQRAALEAAGTFGNMLVPMGIARDRAAQMSKKMVGLAADMASFNNASPEETLQALRSGLAGETEPLRKFGVFLNQARIEQEALSLGLTKGALAAEQAQAALKTATMKVAEATKARARAVREVEAASKAVVTAEKAMESAARSVAASQERLRDASERLSDAQDRQVLATQRVKEAKQALTATQQRARDAQLALVAAREKATQQLKDLRDASADAGLGEERATLALERARERLQQVSADSESSELDRREAMLAVKEAERGLQEAQERRQTTAKDLADAERAGVEGSKEVLAAKEDVRDADRAAEKAALAVRNAQRAQLDALDSVNDALRGVAAAQQGLRRAQTDSREAADRYRSAQGELSAAQARSRRSVEVLRAAQAELTQAQQKASKFSGQVTKGLTAEQKAMATYSIIMKDTKDTQGDFARTSESVANQQRISAARAEDLSATMGKDLLPAMKAIQRVGLGVLGFFAEHPRLLQVLVVTLGALAGAVFVLNVAIAVATVVASPWLAIILGIVVGIALLTAGVILAYKHIDVFREAVDAVWQFIKKYWPLLLGILLGPFALAVIAIIKYWDEITAGIKSAIRAVTGVITGAKSAVTNAAKGLGNAVKEGVVDALVGIGNAAWRVIDNIGQVIVDNVRVIAGWGRTVASAIWNAVVGGLSGIGLAAWNVINNIGAWIAANIRVIAGWGRDIASAIWNAVLGGLSGIEGRIGDIFKRAFNGVIRMWNALKIPGFKINLPKPIPDVQVPGINFPNLPLLAKGGIVTGPTLAVLGERGPEAVVPLTGGGPSFDVRVFIGDTELRGVVRTEIRDADNRTAQVLLSGAH